MTVATAGISGTALAQSNVDEKDVTVKTADGSCDAALFYPAGKGTWAAVLIWSDIMGQCPAFRDMGRRLAGQGYVVLVPNPFYRSAHAPAIGDNFDFNNPEQRARLMGYRGAMTNDGIDHDAQAYLAFLDVQPQISKTRKAGVLGYCMSGALSFRTNPQRSRHGAKAGVTENPPARAPPRAAPSVRQGVNGATKRGPCGHWLLVRPGLRESMPWPRAARSASKIQN
jgi:dienelactone hydrolase